MKKLIILTVFTVLLSGCALTTTEEKSTDNKAALNLSVLKNVKGVDPVNFYYGPCVYLHGEDGEIRNWQSFEESKKESLISLFSEIPLTKLDYSSNPNNVSDEVYVGPLCDCNQYNRALELITQYNLDFPWKLAHGTEGLSSCVDFLEFK
ncbi:hypothetical protein GF376_03970 [Candidatus Peregrinibacteria bacterium]|nr:hypothetical protein [Candidatus Peregrinibacteria bacterium]